MFPNVPVGMGRFLAAALLPFFVTFIEMRLAHASWDRSFGFGIGAGLFAASFDLLIEAIRWRQWWRWLLLSAAGGAFCGGYRAWQAVTRSTFTTLEGSFPNGGDPARIVTGNALIFGGIAAVVMALWLIYRERNRAEA
jgi:hypothetical protein